MKLYWRDTCWELWPDITQDEFEKLWKNFEKKLSFIGL